MTEQASRVALATCTEFPLLEEPERVVIAPLADLGITAVPLVWTDPEASLDGVDLVVLRNTWDYVDDRQAFLRWVDGVQATTGILNPPALVRWNTDKHYLADLATAGVPVVPTRFLEPGDDPALTGDDEVVIKPAVSAGSRDTGRFRLSDNREAAQALVRTILGAGRTAMVQPYVASVDEVGETALLYFNGTFSHAIRKGALLTDQGVPEGNGLFVQEEITPRDPSPAERAVGDATVAQVSTRGLPLYMRVDLLATPEGPIVLEVELTEPSLFLDQAEGAPERFAAAIAARLRR